MRYLVDLEDLPRNGRVAIFGAGSAGVKCKSDLDALRPDVALVCFADSYKTGMIEHTPILPPASLVGLDVDATIVCSHKYLEIVRFLEGLGVENIVVHGAPVKDVLAGTGMAAMQAMPRDQDDASFASAGEEPAVALPCHLRSLFVQHDGWLVPCCNVRSWQRYYIGHITDADIASRLAAFEESCRCPGKILRRKTDAEPLRVEMLNIEFSLQCQASCAMCCVDAPSWKGRYDYYDALEALTALVQPSSLLVQGGEVLAQPRTMAWLKTMKAARPDLHIDIVSNANVGLDAVAEVEAIFSAMSVSVVGFQPETYKRIMGMDIHRMQAFVAALRRGNRVPLNLKYLATPLNVHEIVLFLDWAVQVAPRSVSLCDALLLEYVNMETKDQFWRKILGRTATALRRRLVHHADAMARAGLVVHMEPSIKSMFQITPEFLREQGLDAIVQ